MKILNSLRKHLRYMLFKFQRVIEFRVEIIIWIVLDLLPFLVLFLIWSAIYTVHDELGGLDFSQMLFYYLLVAIISSLSASHFESWRSEEIRMGKIDFFLTKPFSYIKEVLLTDATHKVFYILLFTPAYLIFFYIAWWFFPFDLPSLTWQSLGLALFLLVAAYLIQALIALFIVLLTFWFEGSRGLEHFKWLAISLFSGAMVPRDIMPDWLRLITDWLPLKYLYAVPIEVVQARSNFQVADLAYLFGFILVLILILRHTWNQAIRRYVSAGG
jgi:ABC-2 type transport system permease protein